MVQQCLPNGFLLNPGLPHKSQIQCDDVDLNIIVNFNKTFVMFVGK